MNNKSLRHALTDAEVALAVKRWNEGRTLGEIAGEIGCSVYALSPWLYADLTAVAGKPAPRDRIAP